MPKTSKGAKGSGTIRKKRDNLWEGRITTGRDPKTGRQIQKSIYGKTRDEVSRKLRKSTYDFDEGVYFEPATITVPVWFDCWLSDYTGNLSDNTVKKYRSMTETHIKPAFQSVKLKNLTPIMIQKFINEKSKTLSPKTIHDLHGILHSGLQTAVDIEYIAKNPSSSTKLPVKDKNVIHALSKEDIKNFFLATYSSPYRSIFLAALYTGMRQSELIGLSWNRVDMEKGTILIDRQLQRLDRQYKFTPPKHNKTRTISIGQTGIDLLREVRQQQLENRMRAGSAWSNPDDLVFTNEIGKNFVHSTVQHNFSKIAKAINRPDATMHTLRHTFAINAIQSGVDYKTLSEFLGHVSVSFTLDVYANVSEDMRKSCVDKLEQFYENL